VPAAGEPAADPRRERDLPGLDLPAAGARRPAVVVALGLSAARWFLGPGTLASLRGRLHDLPGVHLPGVDLPGVDLPGVGRLRVLPTYHPSAALRHGPQGEPRRLLRDDLALAVEASR
jgi:DNA polymerase